MKQQNSSSFIIMRRKTYHFYKECCHYYLIVYQHLIYLFLLHSPVTPAHRNFSLASNNQQLLLSEDDHTDLFQSHEEYESPLNENQLKFINLSYSIKPSTYH